MLGAPVGVSHGGWLCTSWLFHSPSHGSPFTRPLHIPCSLPIPTHHFIHSLSTHLLPAHLTLYLLPLHTRSHSTPVPLAHLFPCSPVHTPSLCTSAPHAYCTYMLPFHACSFWKFALLEHWFSLHTCPFACLFSCVCSNMPLHTWSLFPLAVPLCSLSFALLFPFHSHSICLCTPLAHPGRLQLSALLGLLPLHTLTSFHTCSLCTLTSFAHLFPSYVLSPCTFPISLHTPYSLTHYVPSIFLILLHASYFLLHPPFPCTLPALHTCHSQRTMRPNKPRERFIPLALRIPNPPPNTGSGVQA